MYYFSFQDIMSLNRPFFGMPKNRHDHQALMRRRDINEIIILIIIKRIELDYYLKPNT